MSVRSGAGISPATTNARDAQPVPRRALTCTAYTKNAGISGRCGSAGRAGGRGQGSRVAAGAPFRVEVAVLAHQHPLRIIAILAELLRRVDGEQHGFVLGPVRPVLLVVEFDRPLVVMLDDEIACVGHGLRLHVLLSTRHMKGMFPGQAVDFKAVAAGASQQRLCAPRMYVMRLM